MPSERVLICGAGVAGSILAYFLAQHDFEVVVIERSKTEQKLGQGIEIEEPALTVVKAMGILDRLNEVRTGELGFDLYNEKDQTYGSLEAGGVSPTGALEMMRGDLTEVLYKAADASPKVTYHFETTIHSLRQTPDKVIVDLENRHDKSTTTEEFDLMVGADGQRSRTRQLVMGSPEQINCFKPINAFVAYFSIAKEPRDWPNSQLCHFPGRRIIWLRPTGKESDQTSACFIHVVDKHDNVSRLKEANAANDRLKQKEAFAELYSGLGWQAPRVVEQMMKSTNFYSEELVQVKLPKWSQDRVVLVGDAAWAPSPFTGEGNQLAIIGAWVLAQEMSRNRNKLAFEMYEKRLRSYVESCQNIPLGGYMPYLFNPKTSWGIWLFRMTYLVLSSVVNFWVWMKWPRILPEGDDHPKFDLEMEKAEA